MSKHNIEQCIQESLKMYFQDLDGECAHDIYKMVISCVEKQVFEFMLEHTNGNQSLAAKYLGINRNTLHKKLQQYDLP